MRALEGPFRPWKEPFGPRKEPFCHWKEGAFRALEGAFRALGGTFRALEGNLRVLEEAFRALGGTFGPWKESFGHPHKAISLNICIVQCRPLPECEAGPCCIGLAYVHLVSGAGTAYNWFLLGMNLYGG